MQWSKFVRRFDRSLRQHPSSRSINGLRFRRGTALPYMIATVMVRPEYRATLPAITHVDGSARVQTVAYEDNPDFHRLLRQVGESNGREMVLNTSFNVKGQPIVNTPRQAIETFLGTGIDALFLGDFPVTRA